MLCGDYKKCKGMSMRKDFRHKAGSVILMILIIMTALVAIVHSMVRATSYLILLAQEREGYGKKG